jgi:PAS domain S-box-containing protein
LLIYGVGHVLPGVLNTIAGQPIAGACLVGDEHPHEGVVTAREVQPPQALAHAFDALPAAAAIVDESGRVCVTNAALHELFGYREDDLHGVPLESLLPGPGDRRQRVIDARAHAGMPTLLVGRRQQFRAIAADGHTFPVEVTSSRLTNASGTFTVVLIADRSDVRELESMFDGTFESSPQGLAIVDERRQIVRVNAQLARMVGYEASALRGRRLSRLAPGVYDDGDARSRQLAPGADRPCTRSLLHADGHEIPAVVTVTALTRRQSLVSFTPVDRELEPIRVPARLDTASEVEFTHVASHDLKSPLRGVSDLVEWITEELGDATTESVAHNLGRIRARLLRMELLIDQLLAYSRVGRNPGSQRLIDMNDLVADAVALAAVPDSFTLRVDVDVPPFVGSSTPLETVVRNLVSNAVKHHDRDDGAITVCAKAVGHICRIEVRDDGPGVAPVDHARIFRLFQTASARHSDNAGIGLAVCRRLCEAHGATIEIDPTPGRGSTFVVEWPLVSTGETHVN